MVHLQPIVQYLRPLSTIYDHCPLFTTICPLSTTVHYLRSWTSMIYDQVQYLWRLVYYLRSFGQGHPTLTLTLTKVPKLIQNLQSLTFNIFVILGATEKSFISAIDTDPGYPKPLKILLQPVRKRSYCLSKLGNLEIGITGPWSSLVCCNLFVQSYDLSCRKFHLICFTGIVKPCLAPKLGDVFPIFVVTHIHMFSES